jgi:hypothetical protein
MQFLHKSECRIRLMKSSQNPIALLLLPALTGAIAPTLTGCLAEPDGYRYAVPAGAGGNYVPAQPNYAPQPNYPPPARNSRDLPSQPLTVQGNSGEWSPLTETREWHAAATQDACYNIEARFKREGRKVKLTDIVRKGNSPLPFACIFEGEDASPGYVIPPYWR